MFSLITASLVSFRNLPNRVAETDPGSSRGRRDPADERGVDRRETDRFRGLCTQAMLQLTGDANATEQQQGEEEDGEDVEEDHKGKQPRR